MKKKWYDIPDKEMTIGMFVALVVKTAAWGGILWAGVKLAHVLAGK